MYVKKCPYCGSSKVKKNGLRNHVQHYKCKCCNRQFQERHKVSVEDVWHEYLELKQTLAEIAKRHHRSVSTVKRILRQKVVTWEQPSLWGYAGFVHLDATYWGHTWGILLAIDDATGKVLYLAFIRHETTAAYQQAIDEIRIAGYHIRGIVVDGKKELFSAFSIYPVQMCQFHMYQIVEWYLNKHPKMIVSRELLALCSYLAHLDRHDFIDEYNTWKKKWHDFVDKRTIHKDGKSYYLHRRLRTVVKSLDFYLPHLFTYQLPECNGMPNTNNKIEGTCTDLKKNLNNHSGLTKEHRQQFIIEYFLRR